MPEYHSFSLSLSLSLSLIFLRFFTLWYITCSVTTLLQFNCRHANTHFDNDDGNYRSPSVPLFFLLILTLHPTIVFWFIRETQKIKIDFFFNPFRKWLTFRFLFIWETQKINKKCFFLNPFWKWFTLWMVMKVNFAHMSLQCDFVCICCSSRFRVQ